jgi:hypothetical protein
MSFPLSYILIVYSIFLAIWLILSLVALYHMFRFGFMTGLTYGAIFIYIAVSLAILLASAEFIMAIDWNYPVTIFSAAFESLP